MQQNNRETEMIEYLRFKFNKWVTLRSYATAIQRIKEKRAKTVVPEWSTLWLPQCNAGAPRLRVDTAAACSHYNYNISALDLATSAAGHPGP